MLISKLTILFKLFKLISKLIILSQSVKQSIKNSNFITNIISIQALFYILSIIKQ